MELLVKSPFEKGGFRGIYTRCQKFFPPPLTLALSPRWGERG